eukprot:COSAG06_NODE_13868_length_1211_cov_1.169964_1_plen_150_part_00
MLELFNMIWQREGVVHILAGSGAAVPVFAPTYQCSAAGLTKGFVQMLCVFLPAALPSALSLCLSSIRGSCRSKKNTQRMPIPFCRDCLLRAIPELMQTTFAVQTGHGRRLWRILWRGSHAVRATETERQRQRHRDTETEGQRDRGTETE